MLENEGMKYIIDENYKSYDVPYSRSIELLQQLLFNFYEGYTY